MASPNLVLRTVYLSPSVDDRLRDEAYATRTSKNDLIRRYLEAGMKAIAAEKRGKESAARQARAPKPGEKSPAIPVGKAGSAPAPKRAAARKDDAKKAVVAKPSARKVVARNAATKTARVE